MTNDYYVYEHCRLNDTIPFYIGKGKNHRSTKRQNRNPYWNAIVDKHGYVVNILYNNLLETDAFRIEQELISFYGRKNNGTGVLANMTDGGEGPSGRTPWNYGVPITPEARQKNSDAHKGKLLSVDHKAKISLGLMGKQNTLGHHHNQEHRQKLRTKLSVKDWPDVVSPDNTTYVIGKFLKQFCILHNLNYGCMHKVCTGKTKHHKGWILKS